jgi:xanthine dehydrogenase YagR molybdenum-binding subunit
LFGLDRTSLSLERGAVISTNGRSQALPELFKSLGVGVVEEYAEFLPDGAPPDSVQKLYQGQSTLISGDKRKQNMYAFGAEFVEVRVNKRTREIRVPRMVGVFAAGRIMNTRTARSQLMGGLIWGMSSALHEATELDNRSARIVNRDLQDYLVPVNADAREIQVIMLPEVDTAVNPAGVKGLGELGNVGTNAAVANAVFHATGVRVRELPLRIEALVGRAGS